jgi:hypothetical protein
MKIAKPLVLCSVLILSLFSKHTNAQVKHQEATLLVYNVVFGGLTGGIGSILNKPKTSSWHRAFVRGFWQGSLGGTLNYTSKKNALPRQSKPKCLFYLTGKSPECGRFFDC